ncbi:MAG: GNAT family protein [Pseudomonadota bacterium]
MKNEIVSLAPGISLIPVRLGDAEALASLVAANVRHLDTYMPKVATLNTREAAAAYLASALAIIAEGELFEWHIFSGQQLCGAVRINHIERDDRKASVGYYLGAQYQGRGLATMALRAMLEFAFERLDLNRIELRCASENLASQRVAQRLGFAWEGLLRQAELIDGVYHDHFVHALLREDFDARAADELKQAA